MWVVVSMLSCSWWLYWIENWQPRERFLQNYHAFSAHYHMFHTQPFNVSKSRNLAFKDVSSYKSWTKSIRNSVMTSFFGCLFGCLFGIIWKNFWKFLDIIKMRLSCLPVSFFEAFFGLEEPQPPKNTNPYNLKLFTKGEIFGWKNVFFSKFKIVLVLHHILANSKFWNVPLERALKSNVMKKLVHFVKNLSIL